MPSMGPLRTSLFLRCAFTGLLVPAQRLLRRIPTLSLRISPTLKLWVWRLHSWGMLPLGLSVRAFLLVRLAPPSVPLSHVYWVVASGIAQGTPPSLVLWEGSMPPARRRSSMEGRLYIYVDNRVYLFNN